MGRESITARIEVKLLLWNRLGLLKVMALLLLMLVAAGALGALGAMEEKGMEDSPVWCICYQILNTSEHLLCRMEGTDCLQSLDIWEKTTVGREKNCTHSIKAQDFQTNNASLKNDIPTCGGDNNTAMSLEPNGNFSFIIVITIISSSASMLMLILLCVGIMSMILKKWRNETARHDEPLEKDFGGGHILHTSMTMGILEPTLRILKKQRRWDNFLFNSEAVDYQHDAIYSNVINLVAQKGDDFAIYANVPLFQCPRKTSPVVTYAPGKMEHVSSVFL